MRMALLHWVWIALAVACGGPQIQERKVADLGTVLLTNPDVPNPTTFEETVRAGDFIPDIAGGARTRFDGTGFILFGAAMVLAISQQYAHQFVVSSNVTPELWAQETELLNFPFEYRLAGVDADAGRRLEGPHVVEAHQLVQLLHVEGRYRTARRGAVGGDPLREETGHEVELDEAALSSHMRFAGDDATRVAAIGRAAASEVFRNFRG